MSKKSIADLQWPAAGVQKRSSHSAGPPYSSVDALNVRSRDAIQGRERGGSRPGQTKAYYAQLGSGNPVRLLTSVTVVEQDGYTFLLDDFKGSSLGSAWTAASWLSGAPSVSEDFTSVSYGSTTGAVHSAPSSFDTASAYEIGIYITPYAGAHQGKYQIFGRMNTSSPVATTDGFVAELTMTDAIGTYSGSLKTYNAGTATTYSFSGGSSGFSESGWFRVLVSGSTISCTWLGNSLTSQTPTFGGSAGHRFGFGVDATVAGGVCLVDTFCLSYKTSNKAQAVRRPIVASSNGSVYYESRSGILSTLSTSCTLASDRQLMAAERGQKLYIADNGNPRTTQTDGVTDVAGTLLDSASVSDWTALSISTNDDMANVVSGAGATSGTYVISGIHATNGLTLAASAGSSASSITLRVERAPKVYDPLAGTLANLTATAGYIPLGNPLIARYRDRIVLAGAPVAPHVWYMSRQGAPTDWDYAAADTDGGRAVAGTTSDAGTPGEPITALITHGDDCLVFGCTNSLWILRGDPAFNGQLDNLSRNVGVVDKLAFCRGPVGETYFMSRDGLYMLPPGGSGAPVPLSSGPLPREMLDIDNTTYTTTLAYDFRGQGVHVFITPVNAKQSKHWYFDVRTKAFWPDLYPNSYQPTTAYEHASENAAFSGVVLGCRDGYLRRFYEGQETDDGTSMTSYCYYGPLRLGNSDYYEGRLDELTVTTATDSGTVTANVYVGDAHEAAEAASSFYSATLSTAGRNYRHRPRARGTAAFVKFSGSGTRRWGVESTTVEISRTGRQRLP